MFSIEFQWIAGVVGSTSQFNPRQGTCEHLPRKRNAHTIAEKAITVLVEVGGGALNADADTKKQSTQRE